MKASENITEISNKLIKDTWFIPVIRAIKEIPAEPGVYAIRLANPANLKAKLQLSKEPDLFNDIINTILSSGHNLLYIGMASISLKKRLNQELYAKGPGTFFRTLGAILRYTPPIGSLIGKANQKNYRFSYKDQSEIIEWIETNLTVNWITIDNNLKLIESTIIENNRPFLNTTYNPSAIEELTLLRRECRKIALTKF
ncbi:hypothetical protein QRD02_12060 [Aequorivita sp. SDUM287046]|uniref:GIY-YIG catalytic domain-containing protein n=1 Tax=Aequorivita aurantiaca TaxID=3053356 RepID=A0ABT8DMB8_9FLAO|nr:hypothetical protein [Aequorivita aurantiaca]MDN3725121.1 hypothetical protein [Aequorivita aurantiaca]